jgi:hypothetical protein
MQLKNGRSAENVAYVRKGINSRMLVASSPKVSSRPDGSTSPRNDGWIFVVLVMTNSSERLICNVSIPLVSSRNPIHVTVSHVHQL